MKIMDKNKLEIKKLNDGTTEISYKYENNNTSHHMYQEANLVNVNTKEIFKLKDLILYADKNDVFLYKPDMMYYKKKDFNYALSSWVFLDDPRANSMNKKVSGANIENTVVELDSRLKNLERFITTEMYGLTVKNVNDYFTILKDITIELGKLSSVDHEIKPYLDNLYTVYGALTSKNKKG